MTRPRGTLLLARWRKARANADRKYRGRLEGDPQGSGVWDTEDLGATMLQMKKRFQQHMKAFKLLQKWSALKHSSSQLHDCRSWARCSKRGPPLCIIFWISYVGIFLQIKTWVYICMIQVIYNRPNFRILVLSYLAIDLQQLNCLITCFSPFTIPHSFSSIFKFGSDNERDDGYFSPAYQQKNK